MTDPTSISPLRQRMIEDMTARGLARQTRAAAISWHASGLRRT